MPLFCSLQNFPVPLNKWVCVIPTQYLSAGHYSTTSAAALLPYEHILVFRGAIICCNLLVLVQQWQRYLNQDFPQHSTSPSASNFSGPCSSSFLSLFSLLASGIYLWLGFAFRSLFQRDLHPFLNLHATALLPVRIASSGAFLYFCNPFLYLLHYFFFLSLFFLPSAGAV